jgi:hypothetical protein
MNKRPDAVLLELRYAAEAREAQQSVAEVGRAARALTANLIKIAAGTGEPHEVRHQAAEFIQAFDRVTPFSGSAAYPYAPSTAVATGLDWRPEHDPQAVQRGLKDGSWAADAAENALLDAALKVAAARLARQSGGGAYRRLLLEAARELDEAQSERRRLLRGGDE